MVATYQHTNLKPSLFTSCNYSLVFTRIYSVAASRLTIKSTKSTPSSSMTTSSHDSDLALLRAALLDADTQTQAFLAPLLPLRAVQQVLLSFLRDRSRSFTDWVWDPRVRQLLNQLREQNPQAHHHAQDVDRWFERAAQDQWTYQQSMAAATPTSALEDADAAQEDGKRKFKQRDFYAAANAFRKSLDSLSAYNESESDDGGLAVHEWEQEMQERYVTLCTNVAICGLKMNDLSVVREFAQRALAVDATSSKALYATAKLHLLEHMHDAARAVVDRALLHHPTNQLLVKFRDEIDAAREKEAGEQALLAALAKAKLEEAAAEQQEQAARQKAWEDARVTASDFVPLPPLHDDTLAMVHINTYFMRIKQKVSGLGLCVQYVLLDLTSLCRSKWRSRSCTTRTTASRHCSSAACRTARRASCLRRACAARRRRR